MEGFSYSDIFATKGIEYLVIIAFLALLVPFTLILNRNVRAAGGIRKVIGGVTQRMLRIPQGVFFNRNHTWMFMERSGNARLGLDDLLLHLTGAVNFKPLKQPGDSVRRGEVLTEIEQDGKKLQIVSPISGTILDTNGLMKENPAAVNDDPYGRGWLFTIRPGNWLKEIGTCLMASEANDWSSNELARFRDFLTVSVKSGSEGNFPAVLQDGGEPADHCLSQLPGSAWTDFQKEFLEL